MTIRKILPKTDGVASADVNIELATCGIGFLEIAVSGGPFGDGYEPVPELFALTGRPFFQKLDHLPCD